MNRNILTDEHIEELSKILKDSKTEESKLMERINSIEGDVDDRNYEGIPENTEDNPYPYNLINKEVIETQQYVSVDPVTGVETKINSPELSTKSLTEELENTNIELDPEMGKDSLKGFGLSDEEAMKVFDIISRYKAGEKFNIYHELPEKIQNIVRGLNGNNMATINATARDLLNHFINEIESDKAFVDLQVSISNELKQINISQMYNDELKQNMEVELPKKADELEAAGEIEKANTLRVISETFIDSYTLKTVLHELNNNQSIRKKIRKDLSRYKRFVNEFNYKYLKSKFKIKDIKLLEKVLPEVLKNEGITVDDVKKFIIVICKVTKNMSPENIIEHTFMYYTIQNLLMLQYVDLDVSEFGKQIYDNVVQAIKLMKEVETNECNISKK
jgi:hypothetical protein